MKWEAIDRFSRSHWLKALSSVVTIVAGLGSLLLWLSGGFGNEPRVVRGMVIDDNGTAAPGAHVIVVGYPESGTRTDVFGQFVLNVQASRKRSLRLRASLPGFPVAEKELVAGQENLQITLHGIESIGVQVTDIDGQRISDLELGVVGGPMGRTDARGQVLVALSGAVASGESVAIRLAHDSPWEFVHPRYRQLVVPGVEDAAEFRSIILGIRGSRVWREEPLALRAQVARTLDPKLARSA